MSLLLQRPTIFLKFFNSTAHSRLFVLLGIFSSCMLVWLGLFFMPLQNKIYLTRREILGLQQQRQCLQVKFENYTTCLNSVKLVDQKIEHDYKGILSIDENLDFLLNSIKTGKLGCDEIKPVCAKRYGNVYNNILKFNVWGSFKNVLSWLSLVENDEHLVKVSKFALARGGKHQVKMTTTVKMFALCRGKSEKF